MSGGHWQCDPDYEDGKEDYVSRGITTWNLTNQYKVPSLAPYATATLSFTCTTPKCHVGYNTIEQCGTWSEVD